MKHNADVRTEHSMSKKTTVEIDGNLWRLKQPEYTVTIQASFHQEGGYLTIGSGDPGNFEELQLSPHEAASFACWLIGQVARREAGLVD
jgi:hypothetical protein